MEKEKEKEKELGNPNPIKVGISIGDINGIGPEVIIKALMDPRILIDCTPIIYGSGKIFTFYKKTMNDPDFNFHSCKSKKIRSNPRLAKLIRSNPRSNSSISQLLVSCG